MTRQTRANGVRRCGQKISVQNGLHRNILQISILQYNLIKILQEILLVICLL